MLIDTQRDGPKAKAFNCGSDARLRGESLAANPMLDTDLRKYWELGWRDVETCWGQWAVGAVRALPAVGGSAV